MTRLINVVSALRVSVCMTVCLGLAADAAAQTSSSQLKLTGSINAGVNASGGTQSKQDVSGSFDLAIDGGTTGAKVRRQARIRTEGLYGTSQVAGKAKTVGAEMYFIEARPAADLGELLGAQREPDGDSGIWMYGLASVLHTIAFDLDMERAVGAGISCDIGDVSVSADIRHLREQFNTQPEFSSWALGLHQSYSRPWTVGTGANSRTFSLSESLDVVPAFESREALQAKVVVILAIPIIKNWTMPITYGSDYMRNVPPAFKQRFWKTTFSLNYSFGN